jgi:hypothetical protein
MPPPLLWTDANDHLLRRLRAEGHTWDQIAAAMGIPRSAALGRGYRIGARAPAREPAPPRPDPHRDPLPPGDPVSWGALTDGTALHNAAYRMPEDRPAWLAPPRRQTTLGRAA